MLISDKYITFIVLLNVIYLEGTIINKVRDKPRSVTLESFNSSVVIIRWLPPRSVNTCQVYKYMIRFKDDSDYEASVDKVVGNQTQAVIAGLQPDTKYYARIVAIGCRGKSQPTKWSKIKTDNYDAPTTKIKKQNREYKIPGKATKVKTRTLVDSIILTWEPPADDVLVRGYKVGYGEKAPDVNWQFTDSNTRMFTISGLKPSTQYVISLKAFNNVGSGRVVYDLVYTTEIAGPTIGPLTAPIGLKSKVLSPTTVWLQWTDPSLGRIQKIADDRYYVVTYTEMPQGPTYSQTVKALNVVLYSLIPAMTYEFRVQTHKSEASTPFSISVYNTTFEDAPSSPPRYLSVQQSERSSTGVRVSWLPPAHPNGLITGYLIFYAEKTEYSEWTIEGVLGDRLNAEIDLLVEKEEFMFKIQARNAKGYSPISEIVTYPTDDKFKPPVPPQMSTVKGKSIFIITNAPPTTVSTRITTMAPPMADLPKYDFKDAILMDETSSSGKETIHRSETNVSNKKKLNSADQTNNHVKRDMPQSLPYMSSNSHLLSNDIALKDEKHTSLPEIHTLVRHRVSAVLTWTMDEQRSSASTFQITYHSKSDANNKLSLISNQPLFLLDNLEADTAYFYTVDVFDKAKELIWSQDGTLETD